MIGIDDDITLGITGVALTLWAVGMRKQRAALQN